MHATTVGTYPASRGEDIGQGEVAVANSITEKRASKSARDLYIAFLFGVVFLLFLVTWIFIAVIDYSHPPQWLQSELVEIHESQKRTRTELQATRGELAATRSELADLRRLLEKTQVPLPKNGKRE